MNVQTLKTIFANQCKIKLQFLNGARCALNILSVFKQQKQNYES